VERKRFKAVDTSIDDAGHVKFRFAQLNVLDHGNDIISPGAFEQGKQVAMSAWNHSSWGNVPAVGKGKISSDDQWAQFEGDFFTGTATGKENYATVKAMGDLQEYSFGFDVVQQKSITACTKCMKMIGDEADVGKACPQCGTKGTPARALLKLNTFEASPVLMGQGIGTGTDSIKSGEPEIETKGVIAYHDYGNADAGTAWDGPAQVKAADTATLKKICAWYDDSAPDVKGSYKFPHHSADGLKAVWRGVAAAMGRLQGADIPDGDKKAVYTHLAKHYKDFDKDPPSFNALQTGELKFADHAAFVLADVSELIDRAHAISEKRAEKDKEIGSHSKALILELAAELKGMQDEIVRLVKLDSLSDEAAALFAQFQLQTMEIERNLT